MSVSWLRWRTCTGDGGELDKRWTDGGRSRFELQFFSSCTGFPCQFRLMPLWIHRVRYTGKRTPPLMVHPSSRPRISGWDHPPKFTVWEQIEYEACHH